MASPPAPLRSTLFIVFGLLVFAVAAILLLRCLLRCWASSSHTHPRRAGGAARRGVLAERDDHAYTGAAGRRHVEAEAGLARRIAAAAAAAAEEEVQPVREQVEPEAGTDDDTERLIASLPLFTTASPLAALPKNLTDCAVCLSPFDAETKLRLLPACRHTFHAACIDTWLRTNLVCPICRSAISSPLLPLPVAAAGDQEPEAAAVAKSASSPSGRWSQDYRRDEPWQWDMEAARRAGGEEKEPALVALGRWIFGMHGC